MKSSPVRASHKLTTEKVTTEKAIALLLGLIQWITLLVAQMILPWWLVLELTLLVNQPFLNTF
jgi:hypothetical protein